MERAVPPELRDRWEAATHEADPVVALGASNGFGEEWAKWQRVLVVDAVQNGATWDEIGEALGTSRQAAWARFRTTVEGGGEPAMRDEMTEARRDLIERVRTLHGRIKERDMKWHADRDGLIEQVRALDRQRAQDRATLRDEIAGLKQKIKAIRGRLRDPSAPVPD